jgi:hypothetical protein
VIGLKDPHNAWRPLVSLTDEEVELLATVREKLSGPEEKLNPAENGFVINNDNQPEG